MALLVAAGVLERSLGGYLWDPATIVAASAFLIGPTLLVSRGRFVRQWRRVDADGGTRSVYPVLAVATATVVLGTTALAVILT